MESIDTYSKVSHNNNQSIQQQDKQLTNEEKPDQPITNNDDPYYFYLPNYFPHTYDQLRMLLVGYLSLDEAKPFQFVNLLRDLIKTNNLESSAVISFQPIQSFFQQQKPSRIKEIVNVILKFAIKKALELEEAFPKQRLRILSKNCSKKLRYTDRESLILISNMFLCLMPHNSNQPCFKPLKMPKSNTFIDILLRDENDPYKDSIKVKKIAFIINYFELEMQLNIKANEEKKNDDIIGIQRISIDPGDYCQLDQEFWLNNSQKLSKRIHIDHENKMEDHQEINIVNFANSMIGGGSLRKGAAQEEILFLIFPQLFMTVLVCEKMDYNEAIFISNVRRYANYDGFASTLEFKSGVDISNSKQVRKDIICMDAMKYDHSTKDQQYKIGNVLRDLNKAYIAFNQVEECRHSTISTGKWGCGAFKGDPQLKFLLQWIAASAQERPMLFHTFQDIDKLEKINEITIKYLNGKTIGELFGYLKRYSKGFQEFNLFDSIIKMVETDENEKERSKRLQRFDI